MTLSVKDDGKGMPPGAAGVTRRELPACVSGPCWLNGRLSIESRAGEGTEVRLVVPLDGEGP